MNILKQVFRSLKGLPAPQIVVAKNGSRANHLAEVLRSPLSLDAETRQALQRIRTKMERDLTPRPAGAYGPYRTVAEHFSGASSGDGKLTVLRALVRHENARAILEIGTAYGVSAITMALAQQAPNVTTIDFFEPQASIGPKNIASVTAGVECIKERKETALMRLAKEGRRFDFVFHDGGHSGDGYVQDFDTIHTVLEAKALYVIDDIAWDEGERRSSTLETSRRTCLEGWNELVGDPRVEGALVVNRNFGILLTC